MTAEQRAFVEKLLDSWQWIEEFAVENCHKIPTTKAGVARHIAARRAEFERLFPREGS